MTFAELMGKKPVKNRAQRRREAREQKKYELTQEEFDMIGSVAMQEAHDEITDLVLATCLMVMHREFGFGHDRCNRFMDHFEEYLEPILSGEFKASTVEEQVNEELGIEFTVGRKKRPWRKWR